MQITPPSPLTDGEPTWEIAYLFPVQGNWSEGEYLTLDAGRLVELCNGRLEVLPMPSEEHQLIVAYLYEVLKAFVTQGELGKVLFSPLPVKLWELQFREPDVLFMSLENAHRRKGTFWDGADLVMEVVSPSDPGRDLKTKRQEYAKAGIAEYWIVDPRKGTITVLSLSEGREEYTEAGTYGGGETAKSVLLDGFEVEVDVVFSQA